MDPPPPQIPPPLAVGIRGQTHFSTGIAETDQFAVEAEVMAELKALKMQVTMQATQIEG